MPSPPGRSGTLGICTSLPAVLNTGLTVDAVGLAVGVQLDRRPQVGGASRCPAAGSRSSARRPAGVCGARGRDRRRHQRARGAEAAADARRRRCVSGAPVVAARNSSPSSVTVASSVREPPSSLISTGFGLAQVDRDQVDATPSACP